MERLSWYRESRRLRGGLAVFRDAESVGGSHRAADVKMWICTYELVGKERTGQARNTLDAENGVAKDRDSPDATCERSERQAARALNCGCTHHRAWDATGRTRRPIALRLITRHTAV